MRRIAFIGTCQLHVLESLYRRFIVPRTGDEITFIRSYTRMADEQRQSAMQADVIVQQLFDFEQEAALGFTATHPRRLLVPVVTAGFLGRSPDNRT